MQIPKEVREDFIQRIEDTIDDYINVTIDEFYPEATGEEKDILLDNDLLRADIRLELMNVLDEEYFNS